MRRLAEWPPARRGAGRSWGSATSSTMESLLVLTKPARGPALYWHQDWMQWNDPLSCTPWPQTMFVSYYLEGTSVENGCLKIIPGTHRKRIPAARPVLVTAHEQGARFIEEDHPDHVQRSPGPGGRGGRGRATWCSPMRACCMPPTRTRPTSRATCCCCGTAVRTRCRPTGQGEVPPRHRRPRPRRRVRTHPHPRQVPHDLSVGLGEGDHMKRSILQERAERAAEPVVGLIEEHIAEEILSYPKDMIMKAFADKNFISADRANQFLRNSDESDFRDRDQVEADKSRVQALPIVVVRNADGDVLRLRRREKTSDNALHDKVVLWAGGHVRREDTVNGDPLIHCAVRELEEELRLQIRPSALVPIGAVYFDNGGSTSKHVAIAYEWRSSTNDVAVVLSRSEFIERRGTSLSGRFASVDKLVDDVEAKRLTEPWSVELVREYLAKGAFGEGMSLFDAAD